MAAVAVGGAAADRALGLRARHRHPAVRPFGARPVGAAQDRPSWLAARPARRRRRLADRSEAGAGRGAARNRHRPLARHRAGDAALPRSAGGIAVLLWVRDPAEGRRLATYGASLAGGAALGFLLFASYANRAPVCDALSPVWLSVAAAGGAIAVGLAVARAALLAAPPRPRRGGGRRAGGGLRRWPGRIASAGSRAPRPSWCSCGSATSARPGRSTCTAIPTAIAVAALPVAGLVGYAVMLWRHRRDEAKLVAWAATAAPALLAAAPAPLAEPGRAGRAAARRARGDGPGLARIPGSSPAACMLVRVIGTVAALPARLGHPPAADRCATSRPSRGRG